MVNFYKATLKNISLNFLLFIGLCLFGLNGFSQNQTIEFKVERSFWGNVNNNQFTWTVPCGINKITVEAWGSGAGGSAGTGGGGGGAYASTTNLSVTPGTTYTIIVGVGASQGSGDDGDYSRFRLISTDIVAAQGGGSGAGNRLGGLAINCIGTIKSSGGNGGVSASGNGGAGGGGSAGSLAAGGNGLPNLNNLGGNGGIGGNAGGANGGNGGNGRKDGEDGNYPGGGGGERGANGNRSGAGGDGLVKITYNGSSQYCNINFGYIEPITLVDFGGINYSSTASTTDVTQLDIVCLTATVNRNSSQVIKVRGNTVGNYVNHFSVFFDWNQNGIFEYPNEYFNIGQLQNSTGNNDLIQTINIPNSASLGVTKMRVIKNYNSPAIDPCGNYTYGQAEEFIVNVIGDCKKPDKVFANNVEGTLVVCDGTQVVLTQVGGIVGSGEWIWTKGSCNGTQVNSSDNGNASYTFQANFTGTSADTTEYFLHSSCGTGCESVKVIITKPGSISLSSAANTQNLNTCYNTPIIPVVYTATGSPVSIALIAGALPAGVTGTYASGTKTFTINGTPNVGVTGIYNYTLTVSGNSPCLNTPATISGSINVFSVPTLSYSASTASYCTGGPITNNIPTLAGGATATSYSVSPALPAGLSLNTTTGVISGTPTTTQTAANYTIKANTNCIEVSQVISIAISSGNTAYAITPSGIQNVCSDFGGIIIGLTNSDNGISYQLLLNGTPVAGAIINSTGGAISFPLQAVAGTYTVRTLGCPTNMLGSTTINITQKPTTQFTYSSYSFCKAGISDPAFLTGSPQTGTFSATPAGLVFANATTGEIDLNNSAVNNYTIIYTVPAAGGCSNYIFTRNIQILESPNYYSVTGGGSLCADAPGVPIGLNGSQTGVTYTLYRGATVVGSIAGTGTALNFGTYNTAGTYTVQANIAGGCTQQMDYEAVITVNAKPADIVITPASSIVCLGNVVALTATGTPPSSTLGSVNVPSGNINLGIPDNNANGTFSLLRVTGIPVGATITGVSIKFDITHTWDGDLLINLKGPSNKVLNIANGIGGSGNNFINTTVNSTAGNNISSPGNAPFTGTFAPHAVIGVAGAAALNNNNSNVSNFNGLYGSSASSANGDWILSVRDKSGSDVGTFNNWEITISYTLPGNSVSVIWSPATDLYTDPGANTAYIAGTNISTVYAKPATTGNKSYTATVTNGSGCSATATTAITVNPSPIITVTADYCAKSAQSLVVITATSSDPINTWTWSGGVSSINTSTTSIIEVSTAGTFYVSAIANGFGCPGTGQISVAQELVINGDFEQADNGFTSDYISVPSTDFNNGLRSEGTYTVSSQPNFNHNNFWGVDHTTADGNGKFMLVNGAPNQNKVVWKQTVNVLPSTIYYFSAWAVSLNAASPYANLIFKVNGDIVGTGTGVLDPKPNNNLNNGIWKRAYGNWNSAGVSGPVEIQIINLQTATGGNDFGLDDISFATLSSFFNLTSASGTDGQTNICAGIPITDIEYEVGGDGAAPLLTSGRLPAGLQTFWNGRNFRIYGTPTESGNFSYTYSIGLGGACGAPKVKSGSINILPPSEAGTFTTPIISTCYGANINLAAELSGTIGNLTWYSSTSGNPGTFSLASANITNLTSTAYYLAIAQNTNACIKDTSDVVLVGVKNLWVGNSNNWNDPNNWSDKQLPTTGCDDVIIPQVSPKLSPVLSSSPVPVIKNLKLLTGAKLEITNDAFIKIAGAITSDAGAITANEGNIELNAASNGIQGINGNWFKNKNLKRLIVSSDVRNSSTSGDTLNILFGLSFGNTASKLNTGNNITLRSTPVATASVGKLEVGNEITGEFNVERYIKYYQKWNMLSAPIRSVQSLRNSWQESGSFTNIGYGTQITGAGPIAGTGLDNTSNSGSVKYYDAINNNYIMVGNTINEKVNRAEGFYTFVRGNRNFGPGSAGSVTTLRSKGTIYDASNKPTFQINAAPNTFISIGNPYASAVDLMKLAIPNAIETNFYFWDPALWGSYGVGGYQTVSASAGGVITPGSSLYSVAKKYPKVQSGQAIFVRTLITASNPITISFNEDMKADSSILVSRGNNQEADEIAMLSTMIYSTNGDLADGNRVVFSADYTNEVDRYDAIKITNGGINFGLLRNQKKLIVEAHQPISATDTLHYNMSNLSTGSFKLGFSVQNIPAGNEAFLIDKFLQTRTPVSLTDSSFYSFATTAVAASKAADRFMLIFKPAAGPLPVTITGISATRNTDRSIAVRWTVENEVNIEKYTIERSADGRNFTGIITVDPTNSNAYTKNDLSPLAADNFYRIKALTVGGYTQYSAIIKVAPLQELAAINVFPNPIVDQRTQIKFVNQAAGAYELKLYNQAGQLMQQETINVAGNNFVKTFILNNNFAGGVYQLNILHPDGTNKTQQVIIK